jgi:hypothetical protein
MNIKSQFFLIYKTKKSVTYNISTKLIFKKMGEGIFVYFLIFSFWKCLYNHFFIMWWIKNCITLVVQKGTIHNLPTWHDMPPLQLFGYYKYSHTLSLLPHVFPLPLLLFLSHFIQHTTQTSNLKEQPCFS